MSLPPKKHKRLICGMNKWASFLVFLMYNTYNLFPLICSQDNRFTWYDCLRLQFSYHEVEIPDLGTNHVMLTYSHENTSWGKI